MSAEEFPSSLPPEPDSTAEPHPIQTDDGARLTISRSELRAARRDPAMRQLVIDAEEQERRLEAEGRIHP